MSAEHIAILLDGGFVKKSLRTRLKRFPDASDVEGLCSALMAGPLVDYTLYRVFFYDCLPFKGKATHPLTGVVTHFQNTAEAKLNESLIQKLELASNFAVRLGELTCHGWKLGKWALKSIKTGKPRPLSGPDLVPNFEQKGVDMRIGLDIASLALKRLVGAVALVTGDSDMIPAMKLARREGLRVYLDTMKQPVKSGLRVHADILL